LIKEAQNNLYYCLHSHCKLINGACRAAIYDFGTGKVWSINHSASNLLEACRSRQLEELFDDSQTGNNTCYEFFQNLTQKNLGDFQHTPPVHNQPLAAPKAKINFLWLELTPACNNRCLHCYAKSGPSSPPLRQQVPHARWLHLLTEARDAGAEALQLIGGEPLLYPDWKELAVKADALGYSFIEIFTNATLINDDSIAFFKKYNLNIATTLYADNAEAHDRITQNPGSFHKTISAIEQLQNSAVPFRVASIIMKANENEVPGILRLYKKWNMPGQLPDVVRPSGRGDDPDLLPDKYRRPEIRPPFFTSEPAFQHACNYNSCLAGKIAITSDGDVIPCIFARNRICGNILSTALSQILEQTLLQECWCTTKDLVTKCKDCEYRYACPDCRPLAQGTSESKEWLSPSPCPYNPYTGNWEEQHDNDDR
jgi:radical SAM protein with 4Fe4S-binding SPASM domain